MRTAGTAPGRAALVAALVPAIVALVAHRAALGAFFTTDDLILFERARGIAPWPWTFWRPLSGRLWWMALFPVCGTHAAAYHAVSLALYALDAALVARWASRLGLPAPAALLAGGLFGAAATAMTAVWSATGAGELLACAFALVALAECEAARPRAVVAWTAFALALACKESAALAPLAVLLAPNAARRSGRARAHLVVPPLALGALVWAGILLARARTGSLGGEAYAFGFGPHVLANLRCYAAWAVDRAALAAPSGIVPPPAPLEAAGLVALLAMLAAAWSRPAAAAGLALFLLALAPVLPLEHHTYVHYLVLPLAGWTVALAAAVAAVAGGRAGGRGAWSAVMAVIFAATVVSLRATGDAAGARHAPSGLPADSFVRRMVVARRAAESFAGAPVADGTVLVVLRPAEARRAWPVAGGEAAAPAAGAPAYDLLAGALDDGRGLRALVPALRDVRFAEYVGPGDARATFAAAAGDGRMRVCGSGAAGVAAVARLWAGAGEPAAAARLVREGEVVWPGAAAWSAARSSLGSNPER